MLNCDPAVKRGSDRPDRHVEPATKHSHRQATAGSKSPPSRPRQAFARDWSRSLPLLGLGDLDCAEALEWAVDEEDLHRDVRLDVGLAEERKDLAAGQLFDRCLYRP
jgi:hypothetical protein